MIGIFAPNEDVARMTFFGLFALQHRGQEAAGIAVADGQTMSIVQECRVGLAGVPPDTLDELEGTLRHRAYALFHHRFVVACAMPSRS